MTDTRLSLHALALAALLALTASASAAQSFEAGLAAARQGDPATAIRLWAPLAEAGDPRAQHWLAESYWGGWWGVPENLERRAYWHRRAADQDYVPSFVKLGHMYALGHHVRQDEGEALRWFTRAADAGDAEGQYHLASVYFYGHGVPRDPQRAFALWRQAAAQGNEGAQIALCTEAGEGCAE